MRVKFLVSLAAQPRCYTVGEEVDLPPEEAKAFLAAGHARPAGKAEQTALKDESKTERAVTRKRAR